METQKTMVMANRIVQLLELESKQELAVEKLESLQEQQVIQH